AHTRCQPLQLARWACAFPGTSQCVSDGFDGKAHREANHWNEDDKDAERHRNERGQVYRLNLHGRAFLRAAMRGHCMSPSLPRGPVTLVHTTLLQQKPFCSPWDGDLGRKGALGPI